MANTDFNTSAILVNGTQTPIAGTVTTVTGSFSGFTILSGSVNFTNLVDNFGNELASAKWTSVPDGTTIPLFVSSSTVASGSVLFYAISTHIPTETPNAPASYNYATWVTKSLP